MLAQGWLASLTPVPSWQAAANAYGVLVVVGYVVVRFAAGREMGARRDANDVRSSLQAISERSLTPHP